MGVTKIGLTTTVWWLLTGNCYCQLPCGNQQIFFSFLLEAMGDGSVVDDEAQGFSGTRRQRKVTAEKTNIIHTFLSQSAESSMCFSFCVCLCVCVCTTYLYYVCGCACRDGSSIWKINNQITWKDWSCSLELTVDRIWDKSTGIT